MQALAQHNSLHVRDKNHNWVPRQNQVVQNLYNESTFYPAFTKDMLAAKREIIIYSPFVSKYRSDTFNRVLYKLRDANIDVFIFTRPIEECDFAQRKQAEAALRHYEELGAFVYYLRGSIHEKVAVIDREILWEGSLNILSQRTSREMMRRTTDEGSAMQVIGYLGLNRILAEGYWLKYERLYRNLMEGARPRPRLTIRTAVFGLAALAVAWWIFHSLSGMMVLKIAAGLLDMMRTAPTH